MQFNSKRWTFKITLCFNKKVFSNFQNLCFLVTAIQLIVWQLCQPRKKLLRLCPTCSKTISFVLEVSLVNKDPVKEILVVHSCNLTSQAKSGYSLHLFKELSVCSHNICYPPASEVSRKVANLNERKNPHTPICCVFQPAHGCSACRSLVKIDFLTLK